MGIPATLKPVEEMPASMPDRHASSGLACNVDSIAWKEGIDFGYVKIKRSCLSSSAAVRPSVSGATIKISSLTAVPVQVA